MYIVEHSLSVLFTLYLHNFLPIISFQDVEKFTGVFIQEQLMYMWNVMLFGSADRA